ncbi:sugar O-acetyltransferase [Pleionea sediminis]|uniref:sugar O-acetyltransferase n=1 Tax=Pleionea sediminis TaxID=2569479 RepID=UPI0011854761|nr:sugar O-acetyltransferase [Pleionea sediminis]
MWKAFNSLTPEFIQQRKTMQAICREFARDPSKGNLKKLKSQFQYCGQGVFIEYGFHCDYGDQISLGDRVYINCKTTILDGGEVSIGDDSLIGPNVQIITVGHSSDPKKRLDKANFCRNVIIGSNVWIGAGAIILPGVRIEDNAIVGAGSVITRDVLSNTTVAGNPARPINNPAF